MRARNRAALKTELSVFFVDAAFVGRPTFALGAKVQEREADLTGPLDGLRAGIAESQIFSELLAHDKLQSEALREYTALTTYQVADLRGKVHAEKIGRTEYRSPDKTTFVGWSEKGPGLIRYFVLNPLIVEGGEAGSGTERHESAISPANYSLHLLGEQQVGPYLCFVAEATPKRRGKHLFEGRVWIDVRDYAVVRIEGHHTKKLSFWIEDADFVRQYQKIGGFCFPQGGFWLPKTDQMHLQVRLFGKRVLTIDYQDYSLNRSAA